MSSEMAVAVERKRPYEENVLPRELSFGILDLSLAHSIWKFGSSLHLSLCANNFIAI